MPLSPDSVSPQNQGLDPRYRHLALVLPAGGAGGPSQLPARLFAAAAGAAAADVWSVKARETR